MKFVFPDLESMPFKIKQRKRGLEGEKLFNCLLEGGVIVPQMAKIRQLVTNSSKKLAKK